MIKESVLISGVELLYAALIIHSVLINYYRGHPPFNCLFIGRFHCCYIFVIGLVEWGRDHIA